MGTSMWWRLVFGGVRSPRAAISMISSMLSRPQPGQVSTGDPRLVEVIEEQGRHTGEAKGLSNGKAVMSVEDGAGDAVHQERHVRARWPSNWACNSVTRSG